MTTQTSTSARSDDTHLISRSAARFFSGTMLSRITGMVRDICMAYAFGTGSAIAALLVAFRFSHLLRRLLGEGAMQTALIPHFEELRSNDPARAGRFFADLTSSLAILLIAITGAAMSVLWGLIRWNVLDRGNEEIVWLTFLMMPSLIFICLFGINASLLQCQKSYFIPSAAPVIFNLFWIAGILVSSQFADAQAMSLLSLFVVAACLAQWLITLPKVYRILNEFNIKYLWRGSQWFSKDVVLLASPLALGLIGVAASQVNNALDAVFARWASDEGPALLWYAIRLQQLPLALFGIALAGALLPPLSRAAKADDLPLFSRLLDFSLRRTLALMLPMTFALFLFGDMGINIVYGHGDFGVDSTVGTAKALWGYAIGLIPMALVLILAPAFYARGNYRVPSAASVGAMAINIFLNFIMVAYLDLGAPSIAFATSISAAVNFAWLAWVLSGETATKPFTNKTLESTAKIFLICLLATAATLGFDAYIWGNFPAVSIAMGYLPEYSAQLIHQCLRLAADGALFAGTASALGMMTQLHLRS